MKFRFFGIFISAIIILLKAPTAEASTLSLNELIAIALQNSANGKSWSLLESAAESEFKSSDSSLSPSLKADASTGKNSSVGMGKKATDSGLTQSVSGAVVLPTSTGTNFEVSAAHDRVTKGDTDGNTNGATWEAKISQSLLRNGFGKSNDLRSSAASTALKIAKLEIIQDRQAFIYNLENAYWDLLEAKKELKIFEKNMARRSSLESWIKKRMGQFAAEQQDLLQIQTLLSQSKIGYMNVQDAIENANAKIKKLVPSIEPSSLQLNQQELDLDRNQEELLAIKGSGSVVTLAALLANLRSESAKTESLVVEDSLRPELAPYVSYGTSGVDKSVAPAWSDAGTAKHYTARIGISLSMDLDSGIKSEKLSTARLRAESQKVLAEASFKNSKMDWEELIRQKKLLLNQLVQARILYGIQNKKVIAERKRFEQGRTTALQMTTFELDESDSELKIYQLLSSIRKTEALARNFAHEGV